MYYFLTTFSFDFAWECVSLLIKVKYSNYILHLMTNIEWMNTKKSKLTEIFFLTTDFCPIIKFKMIILNPWLSIISVSKIDERDFYDIDDLTFTLDCNEAVGNMIYLTDLDYTDSGGHNLAEVKIFGVQGTDRFEI